MTDDPVHAAYVAALRLLAGRDLTRSQLRERLLRREFPPEAVDAALAQLVLDRAVDDFRVATVRARGAAARHRGRARAVREMHLAGIDKDVARRAVDEVFGGLDERALIEQALARRLKTPAIASPAEYRRLYAFLSRQGFPPADIAAVLRARARGQHVDPDGD